MSADNYIGVYPDRQHTNWYIVYGFMSPQMDDCQYRGEVHKTYKSREKALVAAHDLAEKETVLEYGVIEMDELGQTCGSCYVCINERGIVGENVEHCDICKKPISTSDWKVLNKNGIFHQHCVRKGEG